MSKTAHAKLYDAALETYRAASHKFNETRLAYRARQIGDAEFLAARAEFTKASVVLELAENAYIDDCNTAGEV